MVVIQIFERSSGKMRCNHEKPKGAITMRIFVIKTWMSDRNSKISDLFHKNNNRVNFERWLENKWTIWN